MSRSAAPRVPRPKTPITLSPDLDTWEQQPRESDDRHAQFVLYRAQGPGRTIRDTALTLSQHRSRPVSVSYLQQVAWRYHWAQRARDWDVEQRRLLDAEMEAARHAMVRAQLEDVATLRLALHGALRTLKPGAMTWGEVARVADVMTKIERATLGEPTHTVAVHGVAGAPAIQLGMPASEDARREELEQIRVQLLESLASPDAFAALDPALLDDDQEEDGEDPGRA